MQGDRPQGGEGGRPRRKPPGASARTAGAGPRQPRRGSRSRRRRSRPGRPGDPDGALAGLEHGACGAIAERSELVEAPADEVEGLADALAAHPVDYLARLIGAGTALASRFFSAASSVARSVPALITELATRTRRVAGRSRGLVDLDQLLGAVAQPLATCRTRRTVNALMCGICGSVGRADGSLIEAMNSIQAHRGPDGAGVQVFPAADGSTPVALGHRRLSIIDPSDPRPADGLGDGRYWITYNGELYNFKSLRSELRADGVRFATECDTEVLLAMYEALAADAGAAKRHLRLRDLGQRVRPALSRVTGSG